MTTKTIALSAFLVCCLVAPLSAQTKWTQDFLLRFDPAASRSAAQAAPPNAVVAQVFQTGTVPISIQDVINMMLDNNLDIRSNRFSPRSSALQTLVFYRALQPSLRFTGNCKPRHLCQQLAVARRPSLSNLRHQFGVNFSQALPWGTSLAIDAKYEPPVQQQQRQHVQSFVYGLRSIYGRPAPAARPGKVHQYASDYRGTE